MTFDLNSLHDLLPARFDDIIDVRAPSEFAEDHLPGAINLPVLDDAERAEVGTIYVQESRFRARKIGAAHVAANTAHHLRGPLADRPGDWSPLVYCWRGGQRSGAFATILRQIGWRVEVLSGGYRSYRRQVVDMLHNETLPLAPVLLDGNTGTGKTALLARLAARGAQVIDLEALAGHRGSVFGATPSGQPPQKLFETRLVHALLQVSPDRPVVIEAESNKIGALNIPKSLWAAMRAAPRISIAAPVAARAEFLVRAYQDIVSDSTLLAARLETLRPLQGHAVVDHWHELAAAGANVELAAALMQAHYDPRYAKSQARNAGRVVKSLSLADLSDQSLDYAADEISALLEKPGQSFAA